MQNVDWTGVGDLEIFLFHYLGFEDRIQLLGSLNIKVQFQFKNTFFSIFFTHFQVMLSVFDTTGCFMWDLSQNYQGGSLDIWVQILGS